MYNHFSINDIFWFHFNEHLASFRTKGFPKDVHITTSFNATNNRVNLHVTRNVLNASSKPMIRVVEIEKSDLEPLMNYAVKSMFRRMLKPCDVKTIRYKHANKVWFIPFEEITDGKHGQLMQKDLKNVFDSSLMAKHLQTILSKMV